jgi:predicted metal-binding membrane protein
LSVDLSLPLQQRFGAMRSATRRSPAFVFVAAIALAWGICIAAETSGAAVLVHHHTLYHSGLPVWIALLVVMLAWQSMTAAMMLPSSLPFMLLFARVSARAHRAGLAVTSFTVAYFAVWTGFAAWAMGFDWLLHGFVHDTPWLLLHDSVIAAGILLLAAVYQVTPMKSACLRSCRAPGTFLMQRYRRGLRPAILLGLEHGLFCLGCCWALMLVMFSVGIAHLAWMGALAVVMLVEKALPWGERIVAPVAMMLGVLAVVAVVVPNALGV